MQQQQDHRSGSFAAGRMPLAEQLRRRVEDVAEQQQMLSEFQVEAVRALQVLRQQQIQLLDLLPHALSDRPLPLPSLAAAGQAPLPALDGMKVVLVGAHPHDAAMLEGVFAEPGAFCAGTMEDALARVKQRSPGQSLVVHLCDAEACLRQAADLRHAEAMADGLIHKLKIFRQLGGHVVWTVASLPGAKGPFGGFAHEMAKGLITNGVDRIHVHADAHRLELEARFPMAAGKVAVVAHPGHAGLVPSHVTSETARRKLGLEAEIRLVLMLADGVDESGWHAVTGAVREVAASGLPVRLLPVSLKADDVAPSLSPLVMPLGEGARHQWLLKAADAILIPPRETFSSADLALAASFATVVLAPQGHAPAEMSGLAYDARTPQGLRDALCAFVAGAGAASGPVAPDASAGWTRLAATLYRF
ncbi:hypothetical protein [Rhizobium sp. SGZ-381]|uniref:hypothetical protein n=1 Tax=Rhizobium sp. SGZ-381 TaxID=3342800 RepID=UPI00367173A2